MISTAIDAGYLQNNLAGSLLQRSGGKLYSGTVNLQSFSALTNFSRKTFHFFATSSITIWEKNLQQRKALTRNLRFGIDSILPHLQPPTLGHSVGWTLVGPVEWKTNCLCVDFIRSPLNALFVRAVHSSKHGSFLQEGFGGISIRSATFPQPSPPISLLEYFLCLEVLFLHTCLNFLMSVCHLPCPRVFCKTSQL